MELLESNGMAIAGSFFQKWESHKITDRSGKQRTELDLVVVRKQWLWTVKDCKAVAGEHVAQQKLVVFLERMKKRSEVKNSGLKIIWCRKCRGNVSIE